MKIMGKSRISNNIMKGLAITSKGIEDVCEAEINELINAITAAKETAIEFDFDKFSDLCVLCYKAQSINKILFFLSQFKFHDLEDIRAAVNKLDFSKWVKDKTFRVSSKIVDNDYSSEEINAETGAFIIDKYSPKVSLDNPDIIIFVYIVKDECYLGVDFAGFSLNKRTYKIFHHQSALRGTIAYALLKLADFKDNLLDCFMGSGTIPIEAALYSAGFSVNYYNKEKFAFLKLDLGIDYDLFFSEIDNKIKPDKINIFGYDSTWLHTNNAKKNAKVAGVNKYINFSKTEVEWLDTKFDKGKIDCIVTHPPQLSKNSNSKEIEKIYNEFFYQAEFVLSDKGVIVLISKKTSMLKKMAEKYRFKIKEEREVFSGKDVLKVLVFIK
ncbi:MAG: THUMP domain-containing protein [Nanoarchaeota archaeon]